MVQINFAQKEIQCKIVYYGPGMSGKTTNLELVHGKVPDDNRGELTSIATTASLLNNLANIDFRLGRYEVAAEAHREVVALRRRIFGEIHPSVALSLSGIGSALHMGGRPAEALPVYEEALAIYRQTVGDDHWDTARVVSHRADCLRLVGRYAEAERSLLAALDVLLDTVGEGHRHTRLARERLVSLYDGWDRPELAAAQRALLADRP